MREEDKMMNNFLFKSGALLCIEYDDVPTTVPKVK